MNDGNPRRLRGIRLPDFAGRPITLSSGSENWRQTGKIDSPQVLLLGLGPGETWTLPFLKKAASVHWLEAPQTLSALRNMVRVIPRSGDFSGQWSETTPEEVPRLAIDSQIWFYNPGLRLAPDFWGAILARMEFGEFSHLQKTASGGMRKRVWLPGNSTLLLHHELKESLSALGFDQIMETMDPGKLLACGAPPNLALSVNFRGLDSEGRAFYACQALDIPLAIWLVDNPWHLLAGINYPWWKKAHIFVTDPSFIPQLHAAGAKNAHFLPLAPSSHMWRDAGAPLESPVFVGRSAFPDKDKFFRGVRLPANLVREAGTLLNSGASEPDYHWWLARTGAATWPGLACRMPGLGAENCSRAKRAAWLAAALPFGLRIIGDEAWRQLLPTAPLFPPVDYYDTLPGIYQKAEAVLNVTTLLLPQSLNQRHFDVWAAGGLLLGDAVKGLEIFPKKLTVPMRLESPADFGPRLLWFRQNPTARQDLILAWREELARGHSYTDRVKNMLEHIAA